MLKKIVLSLLVIAHVLNLGADPLELVTIKSDNIKKYQNDIHFIFKRSTFIKSAALGAVVVGFGYLTYKWSLIDSSQTQIKVSKPMPEDEMKEMYELLRKKYEEHDKAVRDSIPNSLGGILVSLQEGGFIGGAKDWPTFFRGYKNWIGRAFSLSFIGGIATLTLSPIVKYFKAFDAAVDRGISHLLPDWSITWFLTTHANLPMVFNDLNRNAAQIDTEHSQESIKEFETSWHLLINQMERILGYICFRSQSFGPVLKSRSLQVADKLIVMLDQTVDAIHTDGCSSYVECIAKLRIKIDDLLQRFLEIEQIERS